MYPLLEFVGLWKRAGSVNGSWEARAALSSVVQQGAMLLPKCLDGSSHALIIRILQTKADSGDLFTVTLLTKILLSVTKYP